jgi:hypothetical protein
MIVMVKTLPVVLEVGTKKVFASAVDWPGWCRSGRTEEAAIEALEAYAPRFAVVAKQAGIAWPVQLGDPVVLERLPGDMTTDFGAPSATAEVERARLTPAAAKRQGALISAAWAVLDDVIAVTPTELRRGPRGGGRDRDKMTDHVLGAEAAYARKIGVKAKQPAIDDRAAIEAMRAAIVEVLSRPSDGTPLVDRGWTSRYAARRIAWHVLDHAWEMQDRTEPAS